MVISSGSMLQLHSTVTTDAMLELSLRDVPIPILRAEQVLIRVEAAPLNPSDIQVMLAEADPLRARPGGTADHPSVRMPLPPQVFQRLEARVGASLPTGNEGAGTVVDAGEQGRHLLGKRVAVFAGGMYAQYRAARASECLVLPDDVTFEEGAGAIINPVTALALIDCMRAEGHRALIHTAAASSLGQMLNRICLQDGVDLVNIVRRPEQAEMLRGMGAVHVCDTSAPSFTEDLSAAIAATGATILFDAIRGGDLADRILSCMEKVITSSQSAYHRYGSIVHKQVYFYGALDSGPTIFAHDFGLAWGAGAWAMPLFLKGRPAEVAEDMRARVRRELKTTFASHYAHSISLRDALAPEVIEAYARRGTDQKYLVRPHGT
ncbi:NADH oxidase [Sphingobium sp. Sx8-8]|uniref:alcohol dehydrogenase catalytic domain-containing protein n=1 Tax=Sphingobium sp. Sx8-8 TaxID=2933617 RepID=UPI001F561C3D|nr:NADH oxidase [Sphingobium sp. Sx8-8]